MTVIIIYLIISFILDGLISNYININLISPSIFRTLYTIISLVIIYNYFDNTKKHIIISLIIGILFDIVYDNIFLINIIIFILLSLLLNQINYYIPNNIYAINLKSIIAVFFYHIITYIILTITNYNIYPIKILLTTLTHSIIMTIIYTTLSYIIIKKIYYNFYEKKIK